MVSSLFPRIYCLLQTTPFDGLSRLRHENVLPQIPGINFMAMVGVVKAFSPPPFEFFSPLLFLSYIGGPKLFNPSHHFHRLCCLLHCRHGYCLHHLNRICPRCLLQCTSTVLTFLSTFNRLNIHQRGLIGMTMLYAHADSDTVSCSHACI